MPNKGIQVKTYFGIPIPPRKNRDRTGGYTLRFVLQGWIPSKKNLHRAVVERAPVNKYLDEKFKGKAAVSFTRQEMDKILAMVFAKIVNTAAYKEWEKATVEIIRSQMEILLKRHEIKHGLVYPIPKCSFSVYNYWRDRHARDTINKMESILDVFVKAKCIVDDDYFTVSPVIGDGEDWHPDDLRQHITVIDLTVYTSPGNHRSTSGNSTDLPANA